MSLAVEHTRFERCLDAVFDAAVEPGAWDVALAELAALFASGFADICSWTPDRAQVSGVVHGLDPEDYHGQMLGTWFNRNPWAEQSPVRVAGEVISTRQMIQREDLARSRMYHDYLHERGLHEGLRLSLWVDAESSADVSLLRPWARGAFGPAEVGLGEILLPHLQRAARLARRLGRTRLQDLGESDDPSNLLGVVAFDQQGRPFRFNSAAEAVLRDGTCLRMIGRHLSAATPEGTHQLAAAVARAIGRSAASRAASTLRLPWRGGAAMMTVVVQPLSRHARWPDPQAPAAVAIFRDPGRSALTIPALRRLFGLTGAEAQVALDLLAGLTVQRSAARTGRSRNTVRAHLARLMEKTGTTRQVDLVRMLMDLDRLAPPCLPFV